MRDTHCLSVKIVGINDAVREHKDNPHYVLTAAYAVSTGSTDL